MFQKIPHRERMRHIKYRSEQWDRDVEKHEREVIRQMIAEKEAAMRQNNPLPVSDKELAHREEIERLIQIMEDA